MFILMLVTPGISKGQADTLVCDNGGFEDGFLFYTGDTSFYRKGSNTCTPVLNSQQDQITWNPSSLPLFRNFEIVTSGIDSLVGIARTKFGSKALLLNHRYGVVAPCTPLNGLDRITKRFRVTAENRDFTVWFATVLENPSGHVDSQPYFSIHCDRAPDYDLCFDASIVECNSVYLDSICKDNTHFDTITVVDWTCHRIKIPKEMVDSIATLEITAADCGAGAHFGYAYVDGICEQCAGGAFGSATLINQRADVNGFGVTYNGCQDTVTVCGSYDLPSICGEWKLDSLKILGMTIFNLVIDTSLHKYCFDIPITYFHDTCVEMYAVLYISSQFHVLDPLYSNTMTLCPGQYEHYSAEINVGSCQDNNTTDLLSDDYYYVQVVLNKMRGDTFTILRQLDDPYPNESGYSIIKTDIGDGVFNLGPFYIQEGSWKLFMKYIECDDTFNIIPPNFCSGCSVFYGAKISNVTCSDHTTSTITDDTWGFDINVPGTGSYYLDIYGLSHTHLYAFNSTHTISAGSIGKECVTYELWRPPGSCFSKFVICPPKPCSSESDCEMDVNFKEVFCNEEGDEFYIVVDTANVGSGYLCYESFALSAPGDDLNDNWYKSSFSNSLGPFTEDVYIIFYKCSTSDCDCNPECFKVIYFPKPDCENLEFRSKGVLKSQNKSESDLFVIPNPTYNNDMIIRSSLKSTKFEIYNSAFKPIYQGNFTGPEYRFVKVIPAGLYFVRYKNSEGKNSYIKVIKL